ncbi:Inactive leucine-rich repeat receptor-like serine/threonine-protein kinase [Hibiscus syriacus]|uniref:Inactive leucine-rich repeat receptor-like serine/threonine-protein kinase n=1 Tax=Hibiscus syriacus TaxID=106335 RepID=A0A6A2XKY6_HIBSY|nr:Inactive leucine-rich repeat receptor-like serine/threonine-protein kinase [Hibiscus syriacus]
MEPFVSRYWFISYLGFTTFVSLVPVVRSGDAEALLALKSTIDPSNSLPWKWTNVCAWKGIKECLNGRVTKLVWEHLTGSLDEQNLNRLDQLRVLSFKSNSISGRIPDLSGLVNLKSLFLNGKNFTGEFPESITRLHRLKTIVLSDNRITGRIPASLLNLKRLYTLYLQDNEFKGTVPALNQTGLRLFNVPNNQRQIPVTSALVRFNISSFYGNIDLCGEQIETHVGRSIPGRRWDPEEKLWGTAWSYQAIPLRNNFVFNGQIWSWSWAKTICTSLKYGPNHIHRSATIQHWRPPLTDFNELNTDGAVNPLTTEASGGGIFRNSEGKWITGFCRSFGRCSILHAELWAVLDDLNVAWRRGFNRIEMEMDNQEAVRILNDPGQSHEPTIVRPDALARLGCSETILELEELQAFSRETRQGKQDPLTAKAISLPL